MGWFWIETPLMKKDTREFFCHFNFARNCSGKWLHGWLNFHLVAASNRSQCWEASVNGLHQLLPPNKPLNGRSCLNPKSRPKHQFVEKRMEEEQVDLKRTIKDLEVHGRRHRSDVSTAFVRAIQACDKTNASVTLNHVRNQVIELGYESDVYVANALITMYVKCGNLMEARHVLDKLYNGNSISWTAMMAGYVKHKKAYEALLLFQQMKVKGLKPTPVTFVYVLNACASLCALEKGKAFHEDIVEAGIQTNVFVSNALIDMYAKCGDLVRARLVFDNMSHRNIVSWTAMIAGYAKRSSAEESLKLFSQMKTQGLKPKERTYVCVINACACLAALDQGMLFHEEIVAANFHFNIFVANALIDMYGKCGSIFHAKRVFDSMHIRDAVSWTSMIKANASHGNCQDALKLFYQMKQEGFKPDKVTFICILNLCAKLAALDVGKQVHANIVEAGLKSDVYVGNALVDFYSKCGNLEVAREVFMAISSRNVISWTTMIAGYALHRRAKEAFELFWQMQRESVKPDEATFGSILSLCSHLGLVQEGRKLFSLMVQDFRLTPNLEHYGCMIDLFGRAGNLSEAITIIKKMPRPPEAVQWTALLAACRLHRNVELAEYAIEHILNCEPQSTAALVQLGNVYAESGRQDDLVKLREMLKNRGF